MSKIESRRNFIKTSLATGCLASVCRPSIATEENKTNLSCEAEIGNTKRETRDAERREKLKLLSKIQEKCGDAVVEVVAQHTSSQIETKYREKNIENRDLSAVKSLLWDSLPAELFTAEKIEDTDERLEYRVTRCQIADSIKDLNEPELAYALVCAWDDGFCKGLNPNLKFTRTKTLINGDDCCNHTYQLKRSDIKAS